MSNMVYNDKGSLFGAVNQQPSEYRSLNQVEEMINAYPTLDKGLLKRNPTRKLELTDTISYASDMWSYAYDRGLNGEEEEKYSLNISDGNLEIINMLSGKVYNESSGITFEDSSKDYLYPFSGSNGYTATTVKDTTFIVNKSVIPTVNGERESDIAVPDVTYQRLTISFDSNQLNAPYAFTKVVYPYGSESFAWNSRTAIVINGTPISVETTHSFSWYNANPGGSYDWRPRYKYVTMSAYKSILYSKISQALGSTYEVTASNSGDIIITSKDPSATPIVSSYEIYSTTPVYNTYTVPAAPVIDKFSFIDSMLSDTISESGYVVKADEYKKTAYIWFKSSNPTNAYSYNISVSLVDGTVVSTPITGQTTTEAAATAYHNAIKGSYPNSEINGSIVKFVSTTEIEYAEATDSYGNQASYAWTTDVQISSDLPKTLGFNGAVVRVTGVNGAETSKYWLVYNDSHWEESIDPEVNIIINTNTLPHTIIRNSDDTFTIKEYQGWKSILVGDIVTNPLPSFFASDDNPAPTIKDIFFFKNRLGFITNQTVVMSEVGVYGNFFRTTVATLLASDYIDAVVDTNEVVSLEYATYLEDSILLFSDKSQFRLAGGKTLTPKDIQISKVSAYNVNINVRPLLINNKIFFVTKRGDFSAVMQYQIIRDSINGEAIDITSHVQEYIPKDVVKLSGNSANNMLFILSSSVLDTIYVYKYFDSGEDRVQAAWFKWTFNGELYNAFSLGSNLNISIKRFSSSVAEDWVIGSGVWDDDKVWDDTKIWIDSPSDLTETNQFELMDITPLQLGTTVFRDIDNTDNSTQINTEINLGEWTLKKGDVSQNRGILQCKTIQINSDEGSDFSLEIEDIARGTQRRVASKYTVGRNPTMYGNAKNIRTSILSDSSDGFRINNISLEGKFNSRATKQ